MSPGPTGRTVTCQGPVTLWRDDLSLTCQKLVGQFDKDGTLKSAHCIGAVKIISPQGNATATDARFDNATNQAVLTGNPRLQQSGSVVEGKVIRFDVKTGEVTVEGGVQGIFQGVPAPSGVTP